MQDLRFTLTCRGCGGTFARSIEPPRSATHPITLYCQHCGCPNEVAPGDGVLRDHWAATTPPVGASVEALPASAPAPSHDVGPERPAVPRAAVNAPERSEP